ncbi:MAG: hypothetical protein HY881_17915 [Deltaproteobacteria bacterium]|nr:hypothetical protein [Deltaproteobacteria bacterium]
MITCRITPPFSKIKEKRVFAAALEYDRSSHIETVIARFDNGNVWKYSRYATPVLEQSRHARSMSI